MATQNLNVDNTPKDIVAELSLTDGEKYLVQALDGSAIWLLEQDSSDPAPDPQDNATIYGFLLESRRTWSVSVESGMSIYAYTSLDTGNNVLIVGAIS